MLLLKAGVWSNGWAALLFSMVQLELRGQIQLLEENGAVNEPKNWLANTLLQTDAPVIDSWVWGGECGTQSCQGWR